MTNYWKHHYFENNSKELHINIFRSLEIEKYFKKTLKDNGFSLQNYQINFSNTTINIRLSICKLKRVNFKRKTNKNKLDKKILKKTMLKKKYFQMVNFYKKDRLKINTQKQKNLILTNLSDKILKSLKIFARNKQNLYLTIKETNSINSNPTAKQILENLYIYRSTLFFKKGKIIMIPSITHKNSAELIGNYITTQIQMTKQQKFFFNFLKKSLTLTINQKFSKLQGAKILIKGRINNANRSRSHRISIGNIPLISKDSKINYAEFTAFTLNGAIGIKIWTQEKQTNKCFYNQKKQNIKK